MADHETFRLNKPSQALIHLQVGSRQTQIAQAVDGYEMAVGGALDDLTRLRQWLSNQAYLRGVQARTTRR